MSRKTLLFLILAAFTVCSFASIDGDVNSAVKRNYQKELARNYTGSLIWWIDTPHDGDTVSGITAISGWVLSLDGISFIDLYIDGTFVSTANLELPRVDVLEHFPDYKYSPTNRPGFTVGFDARFYSNVTHDMYLIVTDSNDTQTVIGEREFIVDNNLNHGPVGYVDSPQESEILSGAFPIRGWALDEDGIDRVDILVDGYVAGGAVLGGERPDIYHSFPMFAGSGLSGWIYNLDTTRFETDTHMIKVEAVDNFGARRVLAERMIRLENDCANLEPFGLIDAPMRDTVLWGCCDTLDPDGMCEFTYAGPSFPIQEFRPLSWVRGWALDLGCREHQGGVAFAELLIDGTHLSNTRFDCRYGEYAGTNYDTYINCYGLPRFDVQVYYPGYVDVPNAGFQFLFDVGTLVGDWGYVEGTHHLSIRVGDIADTVTIIDDIPVTFLCIDRVLTTPSYGFVDHPQSYEAVWGTYHVIGWAVDYETIDEIRVYVDGEMIGLANYCFNRTDIYQSVEASFAGLCSGWDYYLDTTLFSDGEHDMVVEVVDVYGHASIIGERRFIVDNVEFGVNAY